MTEEQKATQVFKSPMPLVDQFEKMSDRQLAGEARKILNERGTRGEHQATALVVLVSLLGSTPHKGDPYLLSSRSRGRKTYDMYHSKKAAHA